MHNEILSKEQVRFLPLVKAFSGKFGLVGGTAIALHIGHRRSIDFDLFSLDAFKNIVIKKKLSKLVGNIDNTFVNKLGEYTIIINKVQFTFFHYPFAIDFDDKFENYVKLPDLLTLAAMKAYALGQRAKWKDYVDLYFILRDHFSVEEIIEKTNQIFVVDFNEKIFRAQLAYFDDINYDEEVDYVDGFEVKDAVVKRALREVSLS